MAGGKAIEHLAQTGNWQQHSFRLPMQQYRNCDFSFSGLQNLVNKAIMQKEKEEGILKQSQMIQTMFLMTCTQENPFDHTFL